MVTDLRRHSRWYWIVIGKAHESKYVFNYACVMDEFGNAVEVKASATFRSLRDGDA